MLSRLVITFLPRSKHLLISCKMGTIEDRNGMDLTEAEATKKRWQEHTEKPYKIDLHDPDNAA